MSSSCSEESSDKECPLCMEVLEIDDLDFYPCRCEYQICRFCWHRIRTDENGLCPACRQPYPENPVNFKPLSTAELKKIQTEKRMKAQAERKRIYDSRKHLASYRVLQKNLVYAVGLPSRVADPEVLKKPEYFGRFGRIIKVVLGTGQSMLPNMNASHTAYVTYSKVEEALRAIQTVNNAAMEGRIVRASLGTTKYCSSFLRNQACYKQDCMYLHEIADNDISFTKEDMHQGKHAEYERRLLEQFTSNPFKTSQCSLLNGNRSGTADASADEMLASHAHDGFDLPPDSDSDLIQANHDISDDITSTGPDNKEDQFLQESFNGHAVANNLDDGTCVSSAVQNDVLRQFMEMRGKESSSSTQTSGRGSSMAESPSIRTSNAVLNATPESASNGSSSMFSNGAHHSSLPPCMPNEANLGRKGVNAQPCSLMASIVEPPPGLFDNYMLSEATSERMQKPISRLASWTKRVEPETPAESAAALASWRRVLGMRSESCLPSRSQLSSFAPPPGFEGYSPSPLECLQKDSLSGVQSSANSQIGNISDDLGFDPFKESLNGLAVLMEEEKQQRSANKAAGNCLKKTVERSELSESPERSELGPEVLFGPETQQLRDKQHMLSHQAARPEWTSRSHQHQYRVSDFPKHYSGHNDRSYPTPSGPEYSKNYSPYSVESRNSLLSSNIQPPPGLMSMNFQRASEHGAECSGVAPPPGLSQLGHQNGSRYPPGYVQQVRQRCASSSYSQHAPQQADQAKIVEWQEGLRALFPTVNIHFESLGETSTTRYPPVQPPQPLLSYNTHHYANERHVRVRPNMHVPPPPGFTARANH